MGKTQTISKQKKESTKKKAPKKREYLYDYRGNNFHAEWKEIPITAGGNYNMTPAEWVKTHEQTPFFKENGKKIYYGKPYHYWEGDKQIPYYFRQKKTTKKNK